jgi:hypothetical protein
VGCAQERKLGCGASRLKRRREGSKRKRVFFLKNIQTIEFEQGFEFKHSKTMHRHACNSKLLYFIN